MGAAQHAQVRIAVDPSGTMLIIEVSDDGLGIGTDAVAGIGLQSMRDRASAVGGSLNVTSPERDGVLVRAEFPLPAADGVKALT